MNSDRRKQAESLAKKIDLPLTIKEVDSYFQQKVVSPLQENLAQGCLFDPCSSCHSHFQLEFLFNEARARKIDKIATGHYARISREPDLGTCVWRAKDPSRDQSVLLSRIHPLILKSLMTPLGHMKGVDVDKLLDLREIPTTGGRSDLYCSAERSQFNRYLKERSPSLLQDAAQVASHEHRAITEVQGGALQYYWGQSTGLERVRETASVKGFKATADYICLGVNPSKNYVFVGPSRMLRSRELILENMQWMVAPDLRKPKIFSFISRYQKVEEVRAELLIDNYIRLRVAADESYFEVGPGDLGVLYEKDLCLGSGEVHGLF